MISEEYILFFHHFQSTLSKKFRKARIFHATGQRSKTVYNVLLPILQPPEEGKVIKNIISFCDNDWFKSYIKLQHGAESRQNNYDELECPGEKG